MRYLMLSLCLLIFALPAKSQIAISGAMRFHQFLVSQGIPVDGVSVQQDPPTNPSSQVSIQYSANATAAQIAQGNAAIATFNWTPIVRNLPGFIQAVRTEPSFTPQIRDNLGKLMGLVMADYTNPTLAQQDWSDAVNNPDNAGWLTTAVQNTIIGYATTFHIPLTSAIP